MSQENIPSFSYWLVKAIRDWLSGNIGIILAVFFLFGITVSFVVLLTGLFFDTSYFIIWGATGTATFGVLFLYLLYLKEHDIISL